MIHNKLFESEVLQTKALEMSVKNSNMFLMDINLRELYEESSETNLTHNPFLKDF